MGTICNVLYIFSPYQELEKSVNKPYRESSKF